MYSVLRSPEDFEPEITDYEIWYSGTQIGERTAVDQQLRHLALDYKGSYTLTVRLYNGDEYVTECEIDTTVMRDVLPIESAQEETTAQEQQCGTYQVDTVSLGSVSTSTLTLSFDATVGAAYYRLESAEGASVYTGGAGSGRGKLLLSDPSHQQPEHGKASGVRSRAKPDRDSPI